jgi:hypothetical protein
VIPDFHREVFRTAHAYHAALANYARSMRSGVDIESAAQGVVGASLRYRVALDRLLQENPSAWACRSRLDRLRKVLGFATRQYNLRKKAGYARNACAAVPSVASNRSSSSRTVL